MCMNPAFRGGTRGYVVHDDTGIPEAIALRIVVDYLLPLLAREEPLPGAGWRLLDGAQRVDLDLAFAVGVVERPFDADFRGAIKINLFIL